jgi:hypothetical protein
MTDELGLISDIIQELKNSRQELKTIRQQMSRVIHYIVEAEAEVPEKMRRFIMYMHDIHDVKNLYEEHGLLVPPHVMREAERCDDRLRQLLKEMHTDGGAFEKVRSEMAGDSENRWDHTRFLTKSKAEPKAEPKAERGIG